MMSKGALCVDQIFALKQKGEKTCICGLYVYLEKAYDNVNRVALWQLLRMYDLEGKLLSGIKSMYVDSSACVRIKERRCK